MLTRFTGLRLHIDTSSEAFRSDGSSIATSTRVPSNE
jgi:hypothetical protein